MTLSTVSEQGLTYTNRQLWINKLSQLRGAPQNLGTGGDEAGDTWGRSGDEWGGRPGGVGGGEEIAGIAKIRKLPKLKTSSHMSTDVTR